MSENTNLEVRDIEKRKLDSAINSYADNKYELLEKVPEVIDWNMFQKRCVPELVQVFQMQCKRLQKRGIRLKTQENEMSKGWESGKVYFLKTVNRYQDGSDFIGVLKKKVKRIREFCREDRILAKFKEKIWFTYFVRQEAGEERKLSSEDMALKALGNYSRELEYQPELFFKEQKSMLGWFLYTPWIFVFCLKGLTALTMLVVGIGFIWTVFAIKSLVSWRQRVKSHKCLASIRQQYPEFYMEKFASMAGNRLKMLFYADSMAEIGDFVSCDLSTFLQTYANVVDCETMDFWFMGMSQDENYEYIDVRQKVLLTGDLGNRMKRKKLTVKIRYMRSKDSIMYTDFYRDWYISEIEV